MAQKPVLRGEVGCAACVAREVSVERGERNVIIPAMWDHRGTRAEQALPAAQLRASETQAM